MNNVDYGESVAYTNNDYTEALKRHQNSESNFSKSITGVDADSLIDQYNLLNREHNISEFQSELFFSLYMEINSFMNELEVSGSNCPELKLSYGGENELILSFKSLKGIHMVSIDEYGDTLINLAGYSYKDSWRKFIDYDQFNMKDLALEFLTSFKFGTN